MEFGYSKLEDAKFDGQGESKAEQAEPTNELACGGAVRSVALSGGWEPDCERR